MAARLGLFKPVSSAEPATSAARPIKMAAHVAARLTHRESMEATSAPTRSLRRVRFAGFDSLQGLVRFVVLVRLALILFARIRRYLAIASLLLALSLALWRSKRDVQMPAKVEVARLETLASK